MKLTVEPTHHDAVIADVESAYLSLLERPQISEFGDQRLPSATIHWASVGERPTKGAQR